MFRELTLNLFMTFLSAVISVLGLISPSAWYALPIIISTIYWIGVLKLEIEKKHGNSLWRYIRFLFTFKKK